MKFLRVQSDEMPRTQGGDKGKGIEHPATSDAK